MTVKPIPLPSNFNPKTNLLSNTTENGVFHESRRGAAFAQQLVANGTPGDLVLAEKVLDAVLACQERRPDDPHYGNFYWMAEDEVVIDLNAVEFNLERLIPMMIRYGDRLSEGMRAHVLEAIRLGLGEIERLDVLVVYSNIALLDIVNTCLGGELLDDERVFQRGAEKLAAWMALTAANGTPYEFNSPTYTSVDIRALKVLADHVQDESVRVMARAAAARLGLSVALHIHPSTGRWSGPHGRAYQPTIACETPPEIEQLENWAADGTLPAWVLDAVNAHPEGLQIDETSFQPRQMTQTTFHSASFSLGTASCQLSGQTNVLMAHYLRPGEGKPGVLYTRYLTNEKWLGDFYHATDRTRSRNLIDEGHFWGAQQGGRAIGLYCPPPYLGVIHSAKAAVIWTGADRVDQIWIGGQQAASLPVDIPPGAVVVIASGSALTAVRPLARTDMGRQAPLRLRRIQDDLVLEIYNYLGPEKSFWEMNWPGAFFRGRPQCGFYLEMAERSDYPNGGAFAESVAGGVLRDEAEAPFIYDGSRPRPWRISYQRDGLELGIEIDLMEWKLLYRWTQDGELGFPMLESSLARGDASGDLRLRGARLRWGHPGKSAPPAWLFAPDGRDLWAAGVTSLEPIPMSLETPDGTVELAEMTTGTLVWQAGQVQVESLTGSKPIVKRN